MKAKELINELEKLDPNAIILMNVETDRENGHLWYHTSIWQCGEGCHAVIEPTKFEGS